MTMTANASKSYIIAAESLEWLREKIEKINRRARRLDVDEIDLIVSVPMTITKEMVEESSAAQLAFYQKAKDEGDDYAYYTEPMFTKDMIGRVAYEVGYVGQPVCLAGWQFVATIQHIGDGVNVLRTVPTYEGPDLPEEFRSSTPERCDHCRARRRRNDTYIVRHTESGEWAQVGSTCVRDFLGTDPSRIVRMAGLWFDVTSIMESFGEDCGFGGYAPTVFPIETFMAFALAEIKRGGFLGRGKAREQGRDGQASADITWSCLTNPKHRPDLFAYPTEREEAEAEEIVEWGKALSERDNLNDYMHNVAAVFGTGIVDGRLDGIATAAVYTYLREMERIAKRKAEAKATADSEYVGEIDKRQEFDGLKVIGKRYIESDYGCSVLYSFLDADGNLLKWFASREQDFDVDDTVSGKATVKRHKEWNGTKETGINRAAFKAAKED